MTVSNFFNVFCVISHVLSKHPLLSLSVVVLYNFLNEYTQFLLFIYREPYNNDVIWCGILWSVLPSWWLGEWATVQHAQCYRLVLCIVLSLLGCNGWAMDRSRMPGIIPVKSLNNFDPDHFRPVPDLLTHAQESDVLSRAAFQKMDKLSCHW